jgi:5-(carboxyamino)imidazole ribonucleotide synthase
MTNSVIGKNHRLGILGGGQLGRMFIQEAISYDIHVHIMENNENAPCAGIATSFTKGDITDYTAVYEFGKDKDVLTVEIENVNIEALYKLESEGVKIYPQPRVLEIIKDKGTQKQFYADNNIPTAPFALISENEDLSAFEAKVPFVHKLRQGGYDGKGVNIIRNENDLNSTFREPSLMEELIPFDKELSVIVARNASGETAVFPTVECEFNDANLVEFLFSPAEINEEIESKAKELAIDVINKIEMVGILAVEMFLTTDGEIMVNEIAPRPHNSGHHTIECNVTSQFEQHMRSVLNLPLGSTKMVQFGAMLNLIGETGYAGPVKYDGINEAINLEGVHPHLYGKADTKPNRKMGHITITGESIEEIKSKAKKIKSLVRVIA